MTFHVRVRVVPAAAARVRVTRRVLDRVAADGAEQAAGYVRAAIVAKGRVSTGRMLAGVRTRPGRGTPSSASCEVYVLGSVARVYRWQDEGTRAHGPRTARALRFRPKGGGVVFAAWVSGVEPGRFGKAAANQLRARGLV